jgi:hypothetical protein
MFKNEWILALAYAIGGLSALILGSALGIKIMFTYYL